MRASRFEELLVGGVRNGVYKPKEFHGRGAKIVNMGELFEYPRLYNVEMKRVELTDRDKRASLLQPGDLLFARRSLVAEGAGKCSIVMEIEEPTTFESSIIRARPDPHKADSSFLYYLFNSPRGRHLLGTILRQVAVSGITGTDLSNLELDVPPLSEQRAIAHILGTLDDKIELNRQMNATLDEIARTLFTSWFVTFDPVRAKAEGRQPEGMDAETAALFPDSFVDSELGPIPEGWEWLTLGEMFALNPRRVLPHGKLATFLEMKNVTTRGHRPLGLETRQVKGGTRFENGDTLLARITPCLENGKTAYVDFLDEGEVGFGSTEYIVMQAKPPLPRIWSYLIARFEPFRQFAIQNMTGTSGRQRVGASDIAKYEGVIPSAVVARRFEELVQPWFDLIRVNDVQSRTLAEVRDTVLPKLLSGEIQVPVAEQTVGAAL